MAEARRAADAVLARFPSNADALLLAGLAAERQGRPQDARTYLERALAAAENYVDVHIALGRVEAGAGRRAEARRHFERAHRTGSVEARGARGVARARRRESLMRIVWSRAIASVFWFATAAYCLLSAIPFASEQFLKPGLVPALVTFAGRHAWISLAALAACAAALAPWLRSGHRGARAFIAAWALAGVALFFAPPLSQLEPSTTALALALLSLVPPVWIALMDLPRARTEPHADAASAPTRCPATSRPARSRRSP